MNAQNKDEVGKWITHLIEINRLHDFYVSKYWIRKRKEVLAENKSECQDCKAKGYYTKATHVHHNQFVRRHPRLALSKTYVFKDKEYINLVCLCHDCHEQRHGYRQGEKKEPLTLERW